MTKLAKWGWIRAQARYTNIFSPPPLTLLHIPPLTLLHIMIRSGECFIGPVCSATPEPVTSVVLPKDLSKRHPHTPKCPKCKLKEPTVVLADMAEVDLVKEIYGP